jgi:hypothetical protein
MTTPENIKSVVEALLAGANGQNIGLAVALADLEPVQNALEAVRNGEPEDFHTWLLYPLSSAVDGLLYSELGTEEARFLVKHYRFVESHFERLIVKYEGRACCADKARTILKRLLSFLTTGKEIAFDYNEQYTFHLPRCIFTTHEDILMFFKGLHNLYYGNPDQYLQALLALGPKATAAAAERNAQWEARLQQSAPGEKGSV